MLRADILAAAIDAANIAPERPRLLMSPRGRPLTQPLVVELAAGPAPLIVCGRFEGIDQRVIDGRGLEEVSIGDYVLSGGEIAAMALIDACVRLLPGVMGKEASGAEESFSEGLLEYPQYTRPQVFEGRTIPEILTSGDHARGDHRAARTRFLHIISVALALGVRTGVVARPDIGLVMLARVDRHAAPARHHIVGSSLRDAHAGRRGLRLRDFRLQATRESRQQAGRHNPLHHAHPSLVCRTVESLIACPRSTAPAAKTAMDLRGTLVV